MTVQLQSYRQCRIRGNPPFNEDWSNELCLFHRWVTVTDADDDDVFGVVEMPDGACHVVAVTNIKFTDTNQFRFE